MPRRQFIDTHSGGDYGADPIGDGMFRMVPSGDVVTVEEKERRMASRGYRGLGARPDVCVLDKHGDTHCGQPSRREGRCPDCGKLLVFWDEKGNETQVAPSHGDRNICEECVHKGRRLDGRHSDQKLWMVYITSAGGTPVDDVGPFEDEAEARDYAQQVREGGGVDRLGRPLLVRVDRWYRVEGSLGDHDPARRRGSLRGLGATAQPEWRFLFNLGDRSPLDYGGYFVYEDATGAYGYEAEMLERESDDDDSDFVVHRIRLEPKKVVDGYLVPANYDASWPHSVEDYDEWFAKDLDRVADFVGSTREEIVAHLTSGDPKRLAFAYESIYDYHGWDNGDSDPLRLTLAEVEARYTDGELG